MRRAFCLHKSAPLIHIRGIIYAYPPKPKRKKAALSPKPTAVIATTRPDKQIAKTKRILGLSKRGY